MTALRVRTRTILLIVCLVAVAVTVVAIQLLVTAEFRGSSPENPEQTLSAVRGAVLMGSLVGAVAALFTAIAAAAWLEAALDRVRLGMLRMVREGIPTRLEPSHIRDVDALSSALDLIGGEVRARTAAVTRDRDELERLIDSVAEGIIQLDAGGRIVRVNRAARGLLKLPAGADAQPIASLVRGAELRNLLARIVAGEEVDACEISFDGDRRILVLATPMRRNDVSAGCVVVFIDLTELRRLEVVRRDFVANVSHELKTPLTSICGYAETLLEDDVPAEIRHRFTRVIKENADRLQHIVDDLLDLSRIESGKWSPQIAPVDVGALAEDVWMEFLQRAAEKKVTFSVDDAARPAVLADPEALRQVFVNLYDNALRYSSHGGSISVSVRVEDGRAAPAPVTIIVRDNGAGIPIDALPRVFERFYRADPARSRAEGGTGLGLSIVKHLLESMGGDVRADSELGRGTAIRFRLPAASVPERL
jgi:two-component system phosphate regulon sensor histidine kinase PhoR